jgi:hypothetical protein
VHAGRPGDATILLEGDDQIVHLVVAHAFKEHLHGEDIAEAGDGTLGRRAAQHARAVQLLMPTRVGQHREDAIGRCPDRPLDLHRHTRRSFGHAAPPSALLLGLFPTPVQTAGQPATHRSTGSSVEVESRLRTGAGYG